MEYIAKPVEVHAVRIVGFSEKQPEDSNSMRLDLEDGTAFVADAGMLARYHPVPGDYVVTQQADGYVYLNPKDVFERKYRPKAERVPTAHERTGRDGHEVDPLPFKIAFVAHEVNRAYCAAQGDHSQPSWDDAPLWQNESAVNGVIFHLENPDAGPEASHENWMRDKVADGWVWGPVKNPEEKRHPCLVPFADLPPEQQAKDYIFRAVVHAMRKLKL